MINVLVIAGKLYIGGAERVCRNIGYFADPVEFRIDYLVFGEKEEAYEAELLEKGSVLEELQCARACVPNSCSVTSQGAETVHGTNEKLFPHFWF